MLQAAVDGMDESLPVASIIAHGAAGPAIVDQAEAGNHDLIVMASRGAENFVHCCSEASAITSSRQAQSRCWSSEPTRKTRAGKEPARG